MKTLILGVGNLLLKDEGVGIHVIQALEQEQLPSGIHLMDGGTGGFHLMSWLEEYERIIMIDATLDNNPPGTV
ncbi:MAG: hydrogenase maturation protease, partial [Prevotella sp.]|nr:hydrogenase maturation protease [Prevotella sp.]